MSLSIEIAPPSNGNQRVSLAGRLDTHTYGELDLQLAPVLGSSIQSLVLDLAGLEYISSAGVRSIFKARKALSTRGGKVVVVNPKPQIQKVFDVVKAVPLDEIFSSIQEADAYLDAMQKKVLRGDDEDE
jgi:anti-anti-sigma factor